MPNIHAPRIIRQVTRARNLDNVPCHKTPDSQLRNTPRAVLFPEPAGPKIPLWIGTPWQLRTTADCMQRTCHDSIFLIFFRNTRQRPERGEPLRKALGQHVRRRMIILLDPDTERAQPSATSSASAARVRYLRLYSSTCGILLDRSDLNQHQ